MRLVSVVALSFLFSLSSVQADSIRLVNGDSLTGSLISYDQGVCIFSTSYGAPVKFRAGEISMLAMTGDHELGFADGSVVVGVIAQDAEGETFVESSLLGKIVLRFSEVRSIKKVFSQTDFNKSSLSADHDNKFGEDSNDDPPLDFLIGSTVLLVPGQYELDFGITYKQSRTKNTLYNIDKFQRSTYSARMLELKTTVRGGLVNGVEGYFSAPVTYSTVEDVSTSKYVRDAKSIGLSDIRAGLQVQLINESLESPSVSLALDISAPTGRKKYRDAATHWIDPLDNGAGHWSIAPGIAFARSVDPVILFGGFSYRHYFSDSFGGRKIQPGWLASGHFGLGIGLNERVSVGARLTYSYNSNMKVDNDTVFGSDSDLIDLSFNASYRLMEGWVVSPNITFGLNADAGTPALGLNLTRRFN